MSQGSEVPALIMEMLDAHTPHSADAGCKYLMLVMLAKAEKGKKMYTHTCTTTLKVKIGLFVSRPHEHYLRIPDYVLEYSKQQTYLDMQ